MRSLAETMFTAETQRPLRRRREEARQGDKETRRQGDKERGRGREEEKGKRENKAQSPLFPCLLVSLSPCLSSPPRFLRFCGASAVEMICLFLLIISSCFSPLAVTSQTGVITGRVVSEDGSGLPGLTVSLLPIAADRRVNTGDSQKQTGTDRDGNFKFTGLAPRVYSVSASAAKSYVPRPVQVGARQDSGYYRVGDDVTITMIKGGAITGRVTNATGEPLIGVRVSAAMIRNADVKPAREVAVRPRFTDDRGYYRIYGLPPGTYVVFTRNSFLHFASPYDGGAPTYHPSSTRETAAEVMVTSGVEAGGIDIRYRGDQSHAVSGSVTDSDEPPSHSAWIIIALTNTATGAVRSDTNFIHKAGASTGFAIYGVTDGEYEITARRGLDADKEVLVSTPRRVVVKGADVGGIELKLLPLSSVAGKFAFEASPGVCESKREWSLEEAMLTLRHETKPGGAIPARSQTIVNGLTEKGEFTVNNLTANRYFLEPRLPNENWYVKAITAPASTAAPANAGGAAARGARQADVARNGIALKAGEKLSGITVTIADGAAGVSGKVAPATEGLRLPARLRIHLIPAEATALNDVLRYAEVFARNNGSFSLSNIAPGKYWLIARAEPDDEMNELPASPVAWDANERAKLLKETEAMKIEIDLKPCQRVSDQVVKYR